MKSLEGVRMTFKNNTNNVRPIRNYQVEPPHELIDSAGPFEMVMVWCGCVILSGAVLGTLAWFSFDVWTSW